MWKAVTKTLRERRAQGRRRWPGSGAGRGVACLWVGAKGGSGGRGEKKGWCVCVRLYVGKGAVVCEGVWYGVVVCVCDCIWEG